MIFYLLSFVKNRVEPLRFTHNFLLDSKRLIGDDQDSILLYDFLHDRSLFFVCEGATEYEHFWGVQRRQRPRLQLVGPLVYQGRRADHKSGSDGASLLFQGQVQTVEQRYGSDGLSESHLICQDATL